MEGFDVEGLAKHLEDVGASYLVFTIGQGDGPRFSGEFVINYTSSVTSKGGFVTRDVPPTEQGLIPGAFMTQLRVLGDATTQEPR